MGYIDVSCKENREKDDTELYSFDVFDTLITRKTAVPKGVFDIIENEIILGRIKASSKIIKLTDYASIRIKSEQMARKNNQSLGSEEVNLNEIYAEFQRITGLSQEDIDFLKQYELKTEFRNVVGLQENIELLKQKRKQGKRVILISDMYMSADEIRGLLMKVDPVFEIIPIYSSADYRKTKYTGGLFSVVQSIECVNYDKWYHFGDNIKSDVENAKKMGIHAVYLPYSNLWEFEKNFLDKHYRRTDVQYAIGLARYLRYIHKDKSYAFHFGVTVAGFFMASYVGWIAKKCRELDIRRLYFIARDGYIPYMVSDKLFRKVMPDLQIEYIYGSRHAWRVPAFDGTSDSLRRLILSYMPSNLKEIAHDLEISIEKLEQYLPATMFEIDSLTFSDLRLCISELCKQKDFLTYLRDEQGKRKMLVRDYLRQEVDTSDNRFAFVDTRGTGYTQECMIRIMHDFYDHPVRTFALHMGSVGNEDYCIFDNMFARKCEIFIEAMFQAPHGSTVGYRCKDETIIPVLDDESLADYDYKEYIKGIMSFCSDYAKVYPTFFDVIDHKIVEDWKDLIVDSFERTEMSFLRKMPCEPIERYLKNYKIISSELLGKSVVLYGAGKFGKLLYEEITRSKEIELVAWLDKNYEHLKDSNPLICGVAEYAKNLEYDKFIIAIMDVNRDIHKEILAKGISEEKIIDLV